MTLNPNKAIIAGVAAGMAEDMNWPVWAVRLFFVLASFVFGLGIVVYASVWLLNQEDTGQMNLGMR